MAAFGRGPASSERIGFVAAVDLGFVVAADSAARPRGHVTPTSGRSGKGKLPRECRNHAAQCNLGSLRQL